ncbi:hypothetical protein [Vibrio parahaemolyticus]|uniref:hypothetical protein n=1 Tax=Vibrio parahaemolyticus TaxID=670 RepID=UPI002362E94A|nr:hypothetical protein [Vibrio parahaemolyticus]
MNAFKTLSKRLKTRLALKSLSEGQVIASKLIGFSSTNAASASLVKASGKLTEKNFVESVQLPKTFEFTEKKFRVKSRIYEYDSHDIILELLYFMMNMNTDDGHSRPYCFSILVDNEEFVVNHVYYKVNTGFILYAYTAATSLSLSKVFTDFIEEDLPDGCIVNVDFETAISGKSIILSVDGNFTKVIDLNKSKLRLLRFNSEALSCISSSEESRLQRCIQSIHNNFGSFTYNDLIKMGEGIEDQPVFITNNHNDSSTEDKMLMVCSDVQLNEGVITISTYLEDYDDHLNYCKKLTASPNENSAQILFWNEAIEIFKSQPNHLREEPVRFYVMSDVVGKQYTVPIGVEFCIPDNEGYSIEMGCLRVVKPRKAL